MYQTIKRILKLAWAQWKRLAGVIGRFQTRIILTLFYILIVGPASLIAKLFRHDPLNRRIDKNARYWKNHEATGTDLERVRHQF